MRKGHRLRVKLNAKTDEVVLRMSRHDLLDILAAASYGCAARLQRVEGTTDMPENRKKWLLPWLRGNRSYARGVARLVNNQRKGAQLD